MNVFIVLLTVVAGGSAAILLRDPVTFYKPVEDNVANNGISHDNPAPAKYKYQEEWYNEMPLDHFSFTTDKTFALRYFINLDSYNASGPIFFYTGNEGSLESFAQNTGFMWEIAPEYGAAVVFAEHRYYGKTMPFGNKSYSSVQNVGYLSSEQALADFAQLIVYLKQKRIPNAKKSPVIAFGGSYGGMLTAWMRIKYPHLIDGGIAASAPVFWFKTVDIPENTYDKIVTRTFNISGCNMKRLIASFRAIKNLAKTDEGRSFLNTEFHLKNKVTTEQDGVYLVQSIQGIMESITMVDYPYPASFLADLPAWPAVCKAYASPPDKSDKENALSAFQIINVYYNTSGQTNKFCIIGNCPDPYSALGGLDGWFWQTCTEMQMPQCSAGPPQDVFDRTCPWTVEQNQKVCQYSFGRIGYTTGLYRTDWAITNYGAQFPTATNIVFSNGYLDPWSGGGWAQEPITKGSLVSIIIEEGAHHLDLRAANAADPPSVREARSIEKLHIKKWIEEKRQANAGASRRKQKHNSTHQNHPHHHHKQHAHRS